ncbi:MAG: glutamate--tRNA ligase [Myxococcales bacterium]|nr:glutamate--tRNA ligase [Myxococcales bacterium]MCB9671919.1 glutamate--tRNA ligase [Alphaproteobacteria bacterium]MCB9694015.1 glutamate--tRNA ligase [Alphaproteobacteria bacterium]
MSRVRTRFAPSPTGSLHVGGARTALYCWLFARRHEGDFLLRIEDTDRARSTEEATRGILRDMRWLGLAWDEGPEVGGPCAPYFQSERLELYQEHVRALLESGHAYEAWESRDELDALRRVAEAAKENFRFRRREPYTATELQTFREEGRKPVVRLKAPPHAITVDDVVVGTMSQAADEIEDVVILKADGFPTYHFGVVVDDHTMAITHVLRGQEHLMNTPKHLAILEALGWDSPVHAHLPIIFNLSGSKMSKRDKAKAARDGLRDLQKAEGRPADDWAWFASRIDVDAVALHRFMKKKSDDVALATTIAAELGLDLPMIEVMDFRRGGYLAEALLNYLALLGWSAGDDRERYTLEELAEAFSLERVNKQPAKFDPVKLQAMNADWLRDLDRPRYLEALHQWFEVVDTPLARLSEDDLSTVIDLFQSRARTFVDLEKQSAFLRAAPTSWDEKDVAKHIRKGGGLEHLTQARAALADVGRWEADSIERAFQRLCEASGKGLGKYAQPVRIAIAGCAVTPSLWQTLAALDREDVLARIDRALEHLAAEA